MTELKDVPAFAAFLLQLSAGVGITTLLKLDGSEEKVGIE
jgi:hypothetical protein